MFRYNFCLLRKSPYEILGLMAGASAEEAKAKFQELARLHHPDMPTGSPEKFREIHAAYQLIKSGKAHEAMGEGPEGKPFRSEGGATAQRYYGKNYAKHKGGAQGVTAEDIRRMKEEAERFNRGRGNPFADASPAMLAGGGLATLVGAYGVYRGWRWLRDPYGVDDARAYGLSTDIDGFGAKGGIYASSSGATPSSSTRSRALPMDPTVRAQFSEDNFPTADGSSLSSTLSSSSGAQHHSEIDESKKREKEEAARAREEAILRENRMRRYDDLREYYFVNDPEGCASRRYMVQRIVSSFIDAALVTERCPFYLELEEGAKTDIVSYDKNLTEVVEQRLASGEIRLARLDQEAVALHTVAALGRIPKISPAQVEWTFVEYKDTDTRGSLPNCLVAIRNKRFKASEGFAQRVVVSGSEELQPLSLHKERATALKSGAIDPKRFAPVGLVPAKAQLMKAPPPSSSTSSN